MPLQPRRSGIGTVEPAGSKLATSPSCLRLSTFLRVGDRPRDGGGNVAAVAVDALPGPLFGTVNALLQAEPLGREIGAIRTGVAIVLCVSIGP